MKNLKEIISYGAESSFDHEDKDKEYPEYIVVVADFGEELGTQTVATFDGVENLIKILKTLDDNTNVFVISHKGEILENRFDRKIEYVKKQNFSYIKEQISNG